jgi:hypothetical protein
MLNDVAIEAVETGEERITDEALERYKPVGGTRPTMVSRDRFSPTG